MSQAQSSQSVSIRLTPMQVLDAVPTSSQPGVTTTWMGDSLATSGNTECQLRISPGEPSELIVQIKNQRDRTLHLDIQMTGDFPSHWCRIGGLEGNAVAPGQQMEAVLYFEVPADFFERHDALSPSKALKIDYRCDLMLYSIQPSNGQRALLDTAPFNLYIRAYSLYPRFLPTIYRQVDLIGRLLKIFEQTFEPTVHAMDALWAHLDPLTAPETLLPFLAHWVGWPSEYSWSVAQQRQLIRHAIELYRWRGTRRGLMLYLHLYTGLPLDPIDTPEPERHISIQEMFTRGFVMGAASLGREALIGGGRPFHFIVRLRSLEPNQIDEALVRRIIDQEKPAFCTYELAIERLRQSNNLVTSSAS